MLDYTIIKDILANSDEITHIVDSWNEGIPFYIIEEGVLYDAFLFSSENRVKEKYIRAQLLIAIDMNNGNVKSYGMERVNELYHPSFDFGFKNIAQSSQEIGGARSTIEQCYISLRSLLETKDATYLTAKTKYLKAVNSYVPKEILANVYVHINENLFK